MPDTVPSPSEHFSRVISKVRDDVRETVEMIGNDLRAAGEKLLGGPQDTAEKDHNGQDREDR